MVKGPFGLERPAVRHRLIIDPDRRKLFIENVGPAGVSRPFTKINPSVEEGRVVECTISDAGTRFGAGSVTNGATTDIEDLPPEAQQEAFERAEKWCDGLLESTSRKDLTEQDIQNILQDQAEAVDVPSGQEDTIEEATAALPPAEE